MIDTFFDSYCGLVCETCSFKETHGCGGCIATGGKPFHGKCEIAECAISKNRRFCGECESFPCVLLKRYSHDPEHGDNGARIERCSTVKLALVREARAGLDPLAPCGFHCDHCFLGQWCGGCRSTYNCCSYATICEGGVCPHLPCCEEKGLYGCWECPELDDCKKGFYSIETEFLAKASALFIRKHGRDVYSQLLDRYSGNLGDINNTGSVEAALAMLESQL